MRAPRCNNWPAALALFVSEKQPLPFDWAINNCCFFAFDWVAMLTGSDPVAAYRERATDALSVARLVDEVGGVEVFVEAEASAREWEEVPVSYAQRGDLVLFDTETGPALGVCLGAESAFAGPDQMIRNPTSACRRAWRI